MLRVYIINKYINKLQNLSYRVKPRIFCENGEVIGGFKIKEIDEDDLLDFERKLGKVIGLTYADLIAADEKDIKVILIENTGKCHNIIIKYHILNLNTGDESIYIERYENESLVSTSEIR